MADIVKLEKKDISRIIKEWNNNKSVDAIADELGYDKRTVKKYIDRYMQQQQQKQQSQPEEKPMQAKEVAPAKKVKLVGAEEPQYAESLYPELAEPEEWLRNFLESYRLKEPFITAQCNRVKRRNQLPSPSDLMVDMKEGDSGQKNLLMIRDIIEDYDYAVDDYLKKRNSMLNMPFTRRHGIPFDRGMQGRLPSDMRRGIPYGDYVDYPYPQQGYYRDDYGYPQPYDGRQGIPIQPMQQYQPPYQTLEGELERFARINQLFQRTEERNPMMERLEQENNMLMDRLNALEEQQRQNLRDENISLKNQINSLAQRRAELEDKLRQLEILGTQKNISEAELKFKELEDRHSLEVMKLQEGGKTRDTIANAVKGGLTQVGAAIARTAQEVGSEQTVPMEGMSDGRYMWQANCPYCNTPITAPISAKVIQCPGCMKRLEVGPPEEGNNMQPQPPPVRQPPPQRTPPIQQRPQPPPRRTEYVPPVDTRSAGFSVEPEIEEEPSVEENNVTEAECPYCNTMMIIPENAKRVACPKCGKRLEVGEMEKSYEIPEMYGGEPEIEIEPEPVVSDKTPIEQKIKKEKPPIFEKTEDTFSIEPVVLDEPLVKPPDWREQRKQPKKKQEEPELVRINTPEDSAPEELAYGAQGPDIVQVKEELFTCPECGKTFEREMQLKGHMIHHKGKRGKPKKKKGKK